MTFPDAKVSKNSAPAKVFDNISFFAPFLRILLYLCLLTVCIAKLKSRFKIVTRCKRVSYGVTSTSAWCHQMPCGFVYPVRKKVLLLDGIFF